MARRKVKITLSCDGFEPLDLDPAPNKFKDLVSVCEKHYQTPAKKIMFSYFNYQVYKFWNIDSDIGYTACKKERQHDIFVAVTLPHQIPKYSIPDVYMDMAKKKVEERKSTLKETEDSAQAKKRKTNSAEKTANNRAKAHAKTMAAGAKNLEGENNEMNPGGPNTLGVNGPGADQRRQTVKSAEALDPMLGLSDRPTGRPGQMPEEELKTSLQQFLSFNPSGEVTMEALKQWWIGSGQKEADFQAFVRKMQQQGLIQTENGKVKSANKSKAKIQMTEEQVTQIETSLAKQFKYDDNDTSTYIGCRALQETVQGFLDNPQVKGRDHSEKRLDLLLHYGEFIYGMDGRPEKAIQPFHEAVDLASKIYPTLMGSDKLANAHDWLGRCYLLSGKRKESELHFQKALEVRIGLYGEDHSEVAQSWHCMGNAAAAFGRYELAKELHLKALDMKKRHLGENHVQVSFSIGMLATDYIDKREFDKALDLQMNALRLRLEHYGEKHPRVADMYFNLAGCHLAMKNLEEAENLLEKSMNIRSELFGQNHFSVALCELNLGRTQISKGDFGPGMQLLEAAKNKFAIHFGEDHPHVTSCAKILERCQKLQEEAEGEGDGVSISGTAPSADNAGTPVNAGENPKGKNPAVNHDRAKSSCCILF